MPVPGPRHRSLQTCGELPHSDFSADCPRCIGFPAFRWGRQASSEVSQVSREVSGSVPAWRCGLTCVSGSAIASVAPCRAPRRRPGCHGEAALEGFLMPAAVRYVHGDHAAHGDRTGPLRIGRVLADDWEPSSGRGGRLRDELPARDGPARGAHDTAHALAANDRRGRAGHRLGGREGVLHGSDHRDRSDRLARWIVIRDGVGACVHHRPMPNGKRLPIAPIVGAGHGAGGEHSGEESPGTCLEWLDGHNPTPWRCCERRSRMDVATAQPSRREYGHRSFQAEVEAGL
jgi:hypothetical protein